MPILLIGILSLACTIQSQAQLSTPPQTEEEYDAEYEKRIRQEVLFGVYIPANLEEAFSELKRLSDGGDIKKFKSATETLVVHKLHFGIGRWISHNWGFYSGSRFSQYLRELGLAHPDDMITFILTTFHRHLNGKPLLKDKLITDLLLARQKEREERMLKNEVISVEKRKRPPEEDDNE